MEEAGEGSFPAAQGCWKLEEEASSVPGHEIWQQNFFGWGGVEEESVKDGHNEGGRSEIAGAAGKKSVSGQEMDFSPLK